MQQVADAAGVSLATVSRVLSDNDSVNQKLKARVLETVESLGYQPDPVARRLRSSASNVLGLIISDIQNPFFTSVVRGVEDAAYQEQMSVLLCNTSEDAQKQSIYLDVMQAERVGGLIVTPTGKTDGEPLTKLQARGIPVVLLDRKVKGDSFDTVTVDNVQGSYTAVKHLLSKGLRRVALVNGPRNSTTFVDRYEGYQQALKAAGVTLDPHLVRNVQTTIEEGYLATKDLLKGAAFEAVFAANNLLTLGVLRALREANKRVSHDVALVGFDDMPWSGDLNPAVTSVAQPTYELGSEAVRLLLRRVKSPHAPFQSVVLKTNLVVRASCGVEAQS